MLYINEILLKIEKIIGNKFLKVYKIWKNISLKLEKKYVNCWKYDNYKWYGKE